MRARRVPITGRSCLLDLKSTFFPEFSGLLIVSCHHHDRLLVIGALRIKTANNSWPRRRHQHRFHPMASTRSRPHPISRTLVAALTTAATVLLAHPAAQAASAAPVEPRGCSFPASDNVKVVVVPEGLTLPNIGTTGPIAVFITEKNQHAYVTLGATKPIRTVDRGAVDAIDSAFTAKSPRSAPDIPSKSCSTNAPPR